MQATYVNLAEIHWGVGPKILRKWKESTSREALEKVV